MAKIPPPKIERLDTTTFEYLKPTELQIQAMAHSREAAAVYAIAIGALVPDGPDKTYALRKLREVAMWVNVAITRYPDGSPREE